MTAGRLTSSQGMNDNGISPLSLVPCFACFLEGQEKRLGGAGAHNRASREWISIRARMRAVLGGQATCMGAWEAPIRMTGDRTSWREVDWESVYVHRAQR